MIFRESFLNLNTYLIYQFLQRRGFMEIFLLKKIISQMLSLLCYSFFLNFSLRQNEEMKWFDI